MKLLLRLALQNRTHLALLLFTFVAMVFATLATQMEVVSIGILTKKAPSFFELFGNIQEGVLEERETVTQNEVDTRFQEIAGGKESLTRGDVQQFMQSVKPKGIVDRAYNIISQFIPLSNHPGYLALLVFLIAMVNAIAMFWHRFTTKLVAIRVSRDLRQNYFEHIQSLPMSFYQQHNIGSLSSRVVSDATAIAEGINATLINYLQTPFTIFSTLFLCFIASWKLTLFIFLGMPLIAYPIVVIARRVRTLSRQLQKNQENFTSVLVDFLAGVQTVKIFAREDFSLKKYREQNNQMARLQKKSAKYDVSSRPIVHTIGMSFLSLAMITGLYVLQMSVPEVIVYCGLLYIFYEPVKKFAETNATIQRGAAAAERMDEVMQITPAIQDAPDARILDRFTQEIEFKNVSFRYADEWILKNLSFTIKKGQTVAIVGPTGSGKSTLVQLLARLFEVNQGAILIDGLPLSAYTQSSLRECMAFVPQKPFLFMDTIAENIAFGRSYTEEALRGAATRAHAIEFIENLPEGFDTQLAEMGKNLSGGQQQRLAIARALFKQSPILIMDEATSSLDALSEDYIKQAIHNLRGEMTQIIIAHRLSTIEDADHILFLEKGELIAEGDKNQLLKICLPFKQMWEMMNLQGVTT